jgi:putative ABC transport system permease protein
LARESEEWTVIFKELLENAIQDLRYSLRALSKDAVFSLTIVATLALGIGATTAVFSVVYGIVLQPLPYPDPAQLVGVGTVGAANYLDWQKENTVFQDIGIIKLVQNFNITGDGEPERVLGGRMTPSVFRVLGVRPILGRVFTDEDGQVEDKVVLSHGVWQRRYAGDRAIIGRTIQLNGLPYTVLGVMPPEFQYRTSEFALWTPLDVNPREPRTTFDYACIARLRKGVTVDQAQAQMSEIQSRLGTIYPQIQKLQIRVSPLLDELVNRVSSPLYFLLGAVLCLLLIGCANVANLLVARSMRKSQELLVRAALGANKWRLILQSVIEVLPLVVFGGTCGLLLTRWMLSLLVPLLPSTMPRVEAIRIDWPVLAFAGVVLIGTAFVTGVWPALQVMHWNISNSLRESGRTMISSGGVARLRSVLVVSQIAAVVVLMVVSSLLIRSFVALRNVDPGFRWNNILSVHLALSDSYLRSNAAFGQFCKEILDRVSALPGVVSAGMVNRLPLAGGNQNGTVDFEGTHLPRDAQGNLQLDSFDWRTATPDYFRTLGIPLIEGRFFRDSDTSDQPRVSIIDERIGRLVWPNQSPISKRLRIGGPQAPWYEIVGVVGHVRHDGLGIDRRPQVYWNYQQRAQPRMALAVRTEGDPTLLTKSVIAAIHAVDPAQPVYDVRPMDEVVERSLSQEWLMTTLLSMFASIALVLASIGIYGVLSYSVGLRTREIGIRMALGSERHAILGMILRQGAALAALGGIIGITCSLLLGRVLRGLLYGIASTDPFSFAFTSVVLVIVALTASFIPARRASKVDPLIALRHD